MCKGAFNPMDHMMKLKGKDYLQVAWRLVWFREDHPDWGIHTEVISHDDQAKIALFKATIVDADGVMKSCGHGSESARDFGDYLEKAETKAVGRALAMLGYGTQFAPELDEGERIVDSPVQIKQEAKPATVVQCFGCGEPIKDGVKRDGTPWSKAEIIDYSKKAFGKELCPNCMKTEFERRKQQAAANG